MTDPWGDGVLLDGYDLFDYVGRTVLAWPADGPYDVAGSGMRVLIEEVTSPAGSYCITGWFEESRFVHSERAMQRPWDHSLLWLECDGVPPEERVAVHRINVPVCTPETRTGGMGPACGFRVYVLGEHTRGESQLLLSASQQDGVPRRVSGDRKVAYGDGGRAYLYYPVWVQEKVAVQSGKKLARLLQALGEERQDWHGDGIPVLDIVDPDLNPQYREGPVPSWVDARRSELKFLEEAANTSWFKHMREVRSLGPLDEAPTEFDKARRAYCWRPSWVLLDGVARRVQITEPIHGLGKGKAVAGIYKSLMHVMSGMFDMFVRAGLVRDGETRMVQMVFKAQSYVLEAGMTYSGMWHLDGVTENIVAVGVYYAQVDEELEGGDLKFRPAHAPTPENLYPIDVRVPVGEGTAVMFSSDIPHRFCMIRNSAPYTARRTFVNMFVIDPDRPVDARPAFISRAGLRRVLREIARQLLGIECLPLEIVEAIRRYVPCGQLSRRTAKEKREEVRETMLRTRSGFGWTHYGNCGNVEFAQEQAQFDALHTSGRTSPVVNTESDKRPSAHGFQ